MKRLLFACFIFLASIDLYATEQFQTPAINFEFSAYLERPVSNQSELKHLFAKGGIYRTFNVFCEKSLNHCSLSIYDIADEYCNSKSVPTSQDTLGFNQNYFPEITIHSFNNEVNFEFNDNSLYGQTNNSLKVRLSQKAAKFYKTKVISISGLASALETSQGVPLQSNYKKLEDRVLCNLGFFPASSHD
jgi:hypothetical protein